MSKEREEEIFEAKDEIDLYELFLIFKKRWKLLVILPFISLILAAIYAFYFIKPLYKVSIIFSAKAPVLETKGNSLILGETDLLKALNVRRPIQIRQMLLSKLAKYKDIKETEVINLDAIIEVNLFFDKNKSSIHKLYIEKVINVFNDIYRTATMGTSAKENIRNILRIKEISLKDLKAEISYLESQLFTFRKNIESTRYSAEKLKMQKKEIEHKISESLFNIRTLKEEKNHTIETISILEEKLKALEKGASQTENIHLTIVELNKEITRLREKIFSLSREIYNQKTKVKNLTLEQKLIETQIYKDIPLKISIINDSIKALNVKLNTIREKRSILEEEIGRIKTLLKEGISLNPIQIIDKPEKLYKPKRLLVVLVSVISSFFLAIFLSLFIEWFSANKRRYT